MSVERDDMTARDYEREAEAARHRLADTLDELHDRLTPGHMLDEVLSYARGGGAGFARALSNAARENPIPTLLIGAGCAMFLAEKTGMTRTMFSGAGKSSADGFGAGIDAITGMRSSSGRPMGSSVSEAAESMADKTSSMAAGVRQKAASVGDATSGAATSVGNRVSGAANSVGERVSGAASSVGSAVSGAASTIGDQVSGAASSLGDTATAVSDRLAAGASQMSDAASSAADQVRRSFHDGTARVSETADQLKQEAMGLGETVQDYTATMSEEAAAAAQRARDQASTAARQAKETATKLATEQPLLLAALGVALGAIIAAALPKSRMEDEFMGGTSDAVKEAFSEVASGQYEKAKTVAAGVADQAAAKAKQEGLTPSGVAEAARSVGDKVKRVADEAIGAAGSALNETSRKPT